MTLLALAEASPAAAVAVRAAGGMPVGNDLFHFSDAARALRSADAALEDGIAAGFGIATTEEGEAAARGAAGLAAPAGIVVTNAAAAEVGEVQGTWIDLGPLLPGGREARRHLRKRSSIASERRTRDAATPAEAAHPKGGLVAPPDDPTEGPGALYWLLFLAAVAFLYLWTAPTPPTEFELIPNGVILLFRFPQGRPRGRRLASSPNSEAVRTRHSVPPNGVPRTTLSRTPSISASVDGSFTHASQLRPRSTDDSERTGLDPQPAQRLDQGHSSARSTSPARKGFRST